MRETPVVAAGASRYLLVTLKRACFIALFFLVLSVASAARGHALDHLRTTDDIGINKIPNKGTSHILVIPVHVGPGAFPADQLSELKTTFAGDGGAGTFREYWSVMSGDRYDPIPTLVEPIVYPDSCPIPSKTVETCKVTYEDTDVLLSGELKVAFADMLSRVRDEQNVDLGTFDVNGADGSADGYFDGVIIASNIADGVAPPLAALFNETIVASKPGGTGSEVSLGNVAMIPPVNHEFAHLFGFIDLYGGPQVNGLMEAIKASLNPFSRQQIGWVDVQQIDAPSEVELPPVLDSQKVLRIGQPPRYLMIDNRDGPKHEQFDVCGRGVYVYSVDEEQLPTLALGFLDLQKGQLYLPNAAPPYLDVLMPTACSLLYASAENGCGLNEDGEERPLVHASGEQYGLSIRVMGEPAEDGTRTIKIFDPDAPEPIADAGTTAPPPVEAEGCACAVLAPRSSTRWSLAMLLLVVSVGARRAASRR